MDGRPVLTVIGCYMPYWDGQAGNSEEYDSVIAKLDALIMALRPSAPVVVAGSAFYSCDPPWLGHRGGITFRVDLPVATRQSDPPAVRREAALRAIAELPHPDVTIWSDGSARGGRNRAAQALIQFHHLNREETVRAPAGAVCSSLRAELTAMREAFAAVADLEDGELALTNGHDSLARWGR
ncbi:hypothetical protein FJT64_027871 [Amphibalanus amphitrite]|uniref:Uncharacterized protein n=1 Tax=Amphibalanus amphitrite TaxID=1232801 RepID=A0A6A4VYU9_AMPAM|nr:hypothetical protein FJT64_027871 [Amphibalanus amphitrite]